ncbi:MAG: hypothetical protein PHU80_11195, partial [Kiritimatiellae bacterium]|nr:hypothetical protein [Kiritimatiellia bacterium]
VVATNRRYKMTVSLGTRSGSTSGYTELGFGAGLWYDTSLSLIAGTSNMVAGTFGEISFGFDTFGALGAYAGQALYARVKHFTDNQGAYDAVRVTESGDPAFVSNSGFEFPMIAAGGYAFVPACWTVYPSDSRGGVIAMADKFGGVAGGALPAPAEGRQAAFVLSDGFLVQDIGAVLSNKQYTLTIAVGTRSDYSAPGTNTYWLRSGTWDAGTTLACRTAVMPALGTFADSVIRFETCKGINADKVGSRLFLVMGGSSVAAAPQCIYDNPRVVVSDLPAAYLANGSFEAPIVDAGGWSGTIAAWEGVGTAGSFGVIAYAHRFGGFAGGPMPEPGEGRQAAFVAGGSSLYQDFGFIENDKIYRLTVAQGRRSDQQEGTCQISLRQGAWNGAVLSATDEGAAPAGTFVNRTIGFETTFGANSAAVGERLFVVLSAPGNQVAFDNVMLTARSLARVSVSGVAEHENLATDELLGVTGPFDSEVDELAVNASAGSVLLSMESTAPTYVLLWLTGGDTSKYSALASELSTGGAQVLTVPDKEWLELNKRYDNFNMLVKLPDAGMAVNWDFSSGCEWDGVVVDKIAVATRPRLGTVISLH